MKKDNFLYVLRLVVTLFAICAVVAGLLAGVNALTADRIAAAKEAKTQAAIVQVLPDATGLRPHTGYNDASGIVKALYVADQGYVAQVAPNGFGGTIDMMVGLDKEGNVLGIAIISHAETPSLGAVAAENSAKGQAFRDQFAGYDGSLDAISGATITSKAVEAGVLAAIECVKGVL